MIRLRLLACTLFALVLVAGCAGDPDLSDSGDDVGADAGSGDAGADVADDATADVATCPEDLEPLDQDLCDCEGEQRDASDALCERTCTCTAGFWACDETCEEPQPLALRFVGSPQLVEFQGDGDGAVQPGEVWTVAAEIAADNAGDGADVLVRLSTDDVFIDLPTDTSRTQLTGLTDTPQGVELQFIVDASASIGETSVTLDASSGFAVQVLEVPVTIAGPNAPALSWTDAEFERIEGDADRQIELGERWQLVTELRNGGDRDAVNLVLGASVSSGALVLDDEGFSNPREVAAGETEIIRWRFDVAADLIELEPLITLTADADDAQRATADFAVPLVPPDTLAVTATRWTGVLPALTLEVDVENTGALDVTGLDWTRINYASPSPCDGDGEPPCEEPFLESLNLGEPDGPASIASGTTGTVELPLAVTGDTPAMGRVLLRASSGLRQHGPYPVDVTVPTE